ncbi:ABC transporter permease subunit [Kitasatospora paracochleata]|uniref:Peptide/nickel transport system permease protein n=1 Tax=Kitasatospora paracochleata TaxID=58354 RepID=A0ABT1IRZ8_9ACTN|nr:ABC transporter permease [Kitasatospora paracochleata]MCP2307406.1 peptide/nickel transport system permease protein [Kitasatospora paracochleata]
MLRFLTRRALGAIVILFLLVLLTYLAVMSLPVDQAMLNCPKGCSPQQLAIVRHNMGLDKSNFEQVLDYVKGLFVGASHGADGFCNAPCLGYSQSRHQFVIDVIMDNYPATIMLALGGSVCFLVIGVTLGMVSAWKQGSLFDTIASSFSQLGQSTQIFFVAPLAMALFVTNLHWLDKPGYTPFTEDPISSITGMILPWLVLSIIFWSNYTRQVRSLMIEQLSEDHIRAARAKGMSNRYVWWRYALRGAMAPIVTIFGLDLGVVLSGAVITEVSFGIHGLGMLAVKSVTAQDTQLELGVLLFSAAAILVFNIVVDAAYGLLDPRVRIG